MRQTTAKSFKLCLTSRLLHLRSYLFSMHARSQIRLTFNQDGPQSHEDDSAGIAVQDAKPTLQAPPMYKVVLFNDDYTPMDFVVDVLQVFFGMTSEQATRVMLQIHTEGRGICGVFPKDVAATKVSEVTQFSRQHQHPLQCVMEKK